MAELTTITQYFKYDKGTIKATISLREGGGISIALDMPSPTYDAQYIYKALFAAAIRKEWGYLNESTTKYPQDYMIFFKIAAYVGDVEKVESGTLFMSQEMQSELAEWCSRFDHIDARLKQVRTHEIHVCDNETQVCYITTVRKYLRSDEIKVTCAFGHSLTDDEIIACAAKCENIKRYPDSIDARCVISASISAFMGRVDLLKMHNDATITSSTLNAATAGGSTECEEYARTHAYKTVLPLGN